MNSIRDNTKDAIASALAPAGPEPRHYEIASGTCDRLGLDGKEADRKGHALPMAVITIKGGVASVHFNTVPVVLVDFDTDQEEPTVEVIE